MADASRTIRIKFDGSTTGLARASREGQSHLSGFDRALSKLRVSTSTFTKLAALGFAAGVAAMVIGLAKVAAKGALVASTIGHAVPAVAGLTSALGTAAGAALLLPGALAAGAVAFGAIKIATMGFGEALKSIGDPAEFAEAIKDLSPNAQATAKAIAALKAPFGELRTVVQDTLFRDLAGRVSALGTALISGLRNPLLNVATFANIALQGVLHDLTSVRRQADLSDIATAGSFAFGNLADAARPLVGALIDIAAVGSTFLDGLTSGAGGAAQRLADWASAARESGRMAQIMSRGLSAIGDFGQALGNIGRGLRGIFAAADVGSAGFLETLKQSTAAFADLVNSAGGQQALRAFFSTVSTVAAELRTVLMALAPAIGPVIEIVGMLVTALATGLGAAVERLSPKIEQFAGWLNDRVIPALKGTGEWVGNSLLPRLQDLWSVLQTKILPVIKSVASDALAGLRNGIDTVRDAIDRNRPQLLQLLEGWRAFADFAVTRVWPILGPLLKFAFEQLGRSIAVTIDVISGLVTAFTFFRDVTMSVVRFVTGLILGFFGAIINGAASAFGWIPGIGPKLQAASEEFRKFRDDVNRWLSGINDRTVTVRADFRGQGGIRLGAMGTRASGGPVLAGRSYLVNELGPELLTVGGRSYLMMGSQSGHVTPNHELGPTEVVIPIHIGGEVVRVVRAEISNANRQLKRTALAAR